QLAPAGGVPSGLSHGADTRGHARIRPCRHGRLLRLGQPRVGSGIRVRAQPAADAVRVYRPGRVPGDRGTGPAGWCPGTPARVRADHRVRCAVRPATPTPGRSGRVGVVARVNSGDVSRSYLGKPWTPTHAAVRDQWTVR